MQGLVSIGVLLVIAWVVAFVVFKRVLGKRMADTGVREQAGALG